MVKFSCFFLLILKTFCFSALVLPTEHSVLHHTDVYFEEEIKINSDYTELVVFVDSLFPGQKALFLKSSKLPCFRLSRLSWGKEYFWRVKYFDKTGQQIGMSPLHHFFIQPIRYPNMEQMRLRVIKNDTANHQGGFIAVDYTRSVFDRKGIMVWTIPVKDTLMDARVQIRDLRMTNENTFTFLTGKAPMEIGYDGRILWKAPYPFVLKGDTIIYHHDFQKTKRGTFLVMGLRKVYRPMQGTFTEEQLKSADVRRVGVKLYQGTQMNLLLEFNQKGQLIWSWDASDHLSDETLNFKKVSNGIPNFATHANAFGQTENPNELYIGYRDLSRIMKIDKKSGKVLKSFGEKYPGTKEKFIEVDFRKQHGTYLTDHGTILLYNNNNRGPLEKTISSVMEIDNGDEISASPVLWEFALNFDTLTSGKGVSGGNVIEVNNRNVLVCAGTLNRIFEVNRKKEVVWDAFVEARRPGEIWQPAPQYRASFKQDFVWHTAKVVLTEFAAARQLQILNSGTEKEEFEIKFIKGRPSKIISLAAGECYQESFPPTVMNYRISVRLLSTKEILPITILKNL